NANKILQITRGKYDYFGIHEDLLSIISKNNCGKQGLPDNLQININIDGLPIAKSSNSTLSPILGKISNSVELESVFIISLFHGEGKNKCNEFLKPFIEEPELLIRNSFIYKNRKVNFKMNAFICDIPAKSFITGTKGHNCYFGCHKCIEKGDYVGSRMTFQTISAKLQSDQSFQERKQIEPRRYDSILEDLQIGMVSQLPLDYMHLTCLGKKKLLLKF
ncbi:hypothetical protein ILUMI_15219, partial [Ignelater luminosus]